VSSPSTCLTLLSHDILHTSPRDQRSRDGYVVRVSDDLIELASPDRARALATLDRLYVRANDGDDLAVHALRTVVSRYRDFGPEIYARILNWPRLFGDATLEAPLIAALVDDEFGCQAWTARACGQLGIGAAEPMLVDLLDHPDAMTREGACQALGRLGSIAGTAQTGTAPQRPSRIRSRRSQRGIGRHRR
jgi:HEAT repeats